MIDRRKFLRLSAITSAAALAGRSFAMRRQPSAPRGATGSPIVISTWDFGQQANAAAWKILKDGGHALDAVEAGARVPEADPTNQSVGLGGRPDRDGHVTLDACIMDARGRCGSVAALEHIVHAVSVARMVMDRTPHVMLAGEGALQFALENGFTKEDLLTEQSRLEWQEWLKTAKYEPVPNIENALPGGERNHDTIGILALDAVGDLGGACTTSGMAYKLRGRVGDSPIIGAGLFVDNEVGAATSTGVGEEVIRIVGSHTVVELMRQGHSPEEACRATVERIVHRDPAAAKAVQVGFLALGRDGSYGAYALQDGFTFSVKSGSTEQSIPVKHHF
ncbi:MAG: N(4)-(beta-N-acetylglucosaminyl)-L-asparaginase [Flavobacteriales bacterium]|nr:N(4)-(beta-N-acetylglucosaminyl)-L-asparaginase [Flavobacteriales bacterium]